VGDVEFDLRYRSVHRNGAVHELNQRCFDLLLLFLREPHLLHTRDEIFRRVWSGAVVEDANITTTIWVLRKALGEEAKGWIRTVAKKGYVFDPPGPLEPLAANDPSGPDPSLAPTPAAVSPGALLAQASADKEPMVATAQRKPRLRLFAALALLALAAVLAAVYAWSQPHWPGGRVMLVAVPDASLVDEASWPVELLRYWTDWQLRSRSDRILVADPSEKREESDVVVVLSVAMPIGRHGEWRVRAQFHGSDRNFDIDKASTAERLVATIDQVSREIVTHFAPDMSMAQLPALTALDPTVAPVLVKAIAAEQRGRWHEAVLLYQKILETTPDFGFARLHLAQSLAELGQSNAAQAQLARAGVWIAALPPALQPPLNAYALGIRQDHVAAAAAFGELWKNSVGERLDWRLAEASNLRKAGRSRDALERLDRAMPDTPAQALPWLIELTEVELANRDLAHARASANDAIALARKLGWDRERALATLLLIDSLTFSGAQADRSLYTDAVAAFESTGDRLGALRAQVNMELRDRSEQAAPIEHLNQLLAEARAAGNVTVESEALRRTALYHFRSGDMRAANERFDQALAVAEAAGDRYLIRLVDQHLLRQESERGDLAAVDRRLKSLRGEELQGSMAFWVGLAAARLHYRRGEFDEVLVVIGKTEEQLRATRARSLPQIAVGLSCMRATVFGHLGRMADATTALQACRSPDMPYFNKFADIGEVEVDLLAGDLTSARRRTADLVDLVVQEKVRPERWSLAVNIAYTLARLGEAEQARQMLAEVLPEIERSGKRLTESDSRTILAEIALTRNDVGEAERQAAIVEKLDPPDDWLGQSRLRIVRIVIALTRGETARARSERAQLHDSARERGDVMTELLTHSLAKGALDELCSKDRHAKLLAQTGMRGVTAEWMMPASLRPTGIPVP
jgi:tetratricopeptide (TPR) repeat protein